MLLAVSAAVLFSYNSGEFIHRSMSANEDTEDEIDDKPIALTAGDEITDDIISSIFTKFSVDRMHENFGQAASLLLEFSQDIVLICLGPICHGDPVHITNTRFAEVLLSYDEWSPYFNSGNKPIIKKFMHNAAILQHQVKRYKWYEAALEAESEDEDVKFIASIVDKDQKDQSFLDFIKSM